MIWYFAFSVTSNNKCDIFLKQNKILFCNGSGLTSFLSYMFFSDYLRVVSL